MNRQKWYQNLLLSTVIIPIVSKEIILYEPDYNFLKQKKWEIIIPHLRYH
jgi:hypothetical protein